MKRRVAQLPLHGGKAPKWLFTRMTDLAGAITMAVVEEYGAEEMLRRLADPWWFQAFGCVLGFDWHSSGVTTVTCGAMKQAARRYGDDLGIVIAGGKGGVSRKTPDEITSAADRLSVSGGDRLVYASRTSAKVDSAAVQDGYQVYHHSFFFAPSGGWCVVQQGMSDAAGAARRYHWLGERVDDFVCEPHAAIENLSEKTPAAEPPPPPDPQMCLLNMVAGEAAASRDASARIVRANPDHLIDQVKRLTEGPTLFAPDHHPVLAEDINVGRLSRIVRVAHERHPTDFEALLGVANVGPRTVRSLALIAELIHEAPVSRRDPTTPPNAHESEAPDRDRCWADYSYAHGGKDGFPYPVDRETFDRNIHVLHDAVRRSRVGDTVKTDALRRLSKIA